VTFAIFREEKTEFQARLLGLPKELRDQIYANVVETLPGTDMTMDTVRTISKLAAGHLSS
jgi:hypothetical protein